MFLGDNLNKVRVMRGYSRKELAELLQVTEQAIWQYEVKNLMPDLKKIYIMSKIFNVKTRFFLKEHHQFFRENKRINKSHIAFRSLNSDVNNKILQMQYMYAMYQINLTEYLYDCLKIPNSQIKSLNQISQEIQLKNVEFKNRAGVISEIASVARHMLMNDEENNNNFLFNLEKAGIIIYEKTIDVDADAFSFWTEDGKDAVIVLGNDKKVAVRRNFDLAHELGHLLLHQNVEFDLMSHQEYKEHEKEAHMFASFFLLPEDSFIQEFNLIKRKSNPDSYLPLKEKWKVSYQAIATRAYKLGLLSHQQYRYFYMSINNKKYKNFEPLDDRITLEKPMKIKSIFKLLLDNNVISMNDLLDDISIEIEFLSDLTGIEKEFFIQFMEKEKNDFGFIEKNYKIKNLSNTKR